MKKLFLSMMMVLPLLASAQKFGHVNTQELFSQMPELKVVQAKMDSIQSDYESQFVVMREEFNKKATDFQQNGATMSESVKQFRQQELADLQQRIELFAQTVQQDLQKRQQELIAPIQERMVKAIKEVGDAEGYTYIFDSAAMVYISPAATDLMPSVKVKLGIK